jgi:hypothetical protein
VAEPLVVLTFRKENVGILAELKCYAEAQAKEGDLTLILLGIERGLVDATSAIRDRN